MLALLALSASAGSLKFNGTTSSVLLENSVTGLRFAGTSPFTIEAWVKVNSLSSFQTILSKWNGNVAGEYYLGVNPNGTLLFHREVAPNFDFNSSNAIPVGVWTHVAVTYTNGTRQFYFNGQLDPAIDPGSASIPAGPTAVLIGARFVSNLPASSLNGDLDEVRVWNTARSAAELQQNLNHRLTGTEANLMAYYPADEVIGTRVLDFSGRSFTGLLQGGAVVNRAADATQPVAIPRDASGVKTNAATFTAWADGSGLPTTNHFEFGPGSTALRFDGVNDYVSLPVGVIPSSGDFSVEVWAKLPAAPSSYREIFSQGTSGNAIYIGTDTANNIRLGDGWGAPGIPFPVGGWHHFAMTKNSTNRFFYLDGVLVAQRGVAGANPAATELRIGRQYGGNAEYWPGSVDEVRVWSGVALDAATIQDWMFKEVDNTHPDFAALNGYWKLNEGVGTVAADSSGNSSAGTLLNGLLWQEGVRPALTQSTPPVAVTGTNAALDLNGTSAYVDVPDAVWFNGNFTIELKAFIRSYSYWGRFLDFANGQGLNEVIVSQDGSGRLALYLVNPSTTFLFATNQLPLNQWVNLAVTVQGTTATLYQDGQVVGSGTVTPPTAIVTTQNWIGRPHWSGETYGNEILDDIRIWNVARTGNEIRAGMTEVADPSHPNLLLNYRFDGDSGQTVTDARTTFPKNGTLLGGAALVAAPAPAVLPLVTGAASGLTPGTRYHFRSVSQNTNGTTASTINGLATLTPGRGTALDFDGRDDQVTGVVPQLPTGNSPYTIEAWIKPNVMGDDGIVGWGNYGVNNQVNALRIYPSGIHHYWWNNDLSAPVGDLTDGWHHVAASYDGTVRKIYVDGVVRAAANAAGHNVTTTANFAIGKTVNQEFFDGQIDVVRIWNVARTDGEVAQFMNERLAGTETGLVLYHRLDEGGGSIARDSTANATELGLLGAPEWAGSQAGVAMPLATTDPASGIGLGAAQLNGRVNLENTQPSRYWFEYGVAGNLNLTTPEMALPVGVALMNVSVMITNLDIAPNYTFRLVAANDNGTNRGAIQEFIMPVPGAQTALFFDGVNDQVVVGNSTAYKATTNLTVEAWIYPTGPGSIDSGIIVNKEGEYEFARFGDGTLRWAIANTFPGWLWINTGVIAPLHQWMHVAFSYDGNFMRLYTNGVQASAGTATGVIDDIDETRNELRIGGRQGTSQFFQGDIDDVRVWLVARSPAQIAASFNRKLIPPQPGLAAYFRFDEGIGTTTTNLANATTSTLFGGPVWIPSGAGIIDPVVTTLAPTPVLATSATLRGSVNPSGDTVTTYFEYGSTVAYGSTTTPANYPASLATLPISAGLTGLEPGTTYHYRLVGYNPAQTNYGLNQTFTTLVLGSGWPVSTKLTGGEASAPLHVLDGLGNTYVAGVFSGSASFKSPLAPAGGATANAFVGKMSRTADWLWAINIPASSSGFTSIKAIAVDASRNVYVAGQFSGTNTFGGTNLVSNGDTNLFVAKLDSFGTNWLWAHAVGGGGTDSAQALTVVGNQIFVAGSYSGTAMFGDTTLTNAGGSDAFAASLDLNGNWLWANRGGGANNDLVNTLATDNNTNVYLAGHFSGAATFGTTALTSAGGTDLFVGKLTPAGTWLDVRRGGGGNNDTATALIRNAANEFYLVGQFGGTADYGGTINNLNVGSSTNIFVLKLNTEAVYQDYTQGGPGHARSVTLDSLGRVYVVGDFTFATSFGTNSLISSGNSDVFVAQLVGGEWTWAQKIGSAGTETGGSISADTDNSVVVSGTYQGTIQIGYVALTSPNNRDIFVARLDAGRVYEHNNYIVGQEIPVPLDAQDLAYTNGAFGQPIITILEKDQPDSDALNSFVWSLAEHKLFPVRQVTAILKWPLTTNPTNTTAVVTAVGRIAYPTNPVVHIANAPAELEPAVAGFPLKFLNLSFTTINGASVDASTKVFTAPQPGWSVLHFLNSEGVTPDPLVHPSKFEVVRTFNWNDPQHLLNAQPADIGAALTHPSHSDPTEKNGYVYFESALFDGAGDERAHDRASRTGPIIPVNEDTASATDDLVVVWYRVSGNGIAWPGTPVRYVAAWPTNATELVLASRLGSGPLGLMDYPSKRVYRQPDRNLPGFNPNEEHAALYGDTLYALRNDLNEVVSPKASEPYTLLKYIDPNSGQWAMRVFKVVTTNATFPLTYNGVAGQPLLLPEPLSFLNLCNFSNRYISGPGFQDHLGRLYARAAGPGASGTNIVVQYWYPLQPGFDGMTNSAVGACVPWLDRRPGGLAGTPVDITYNITWPVGAPTLQIGETLLNAKFGLPAIRNFASANVIYDQGNPSATNALDSFVRLFDPLSARTLQLATNFVLPATIATANDAGKLVFTDLPYALRSRLRYDNLNKQLSFSGLLDESVAYGGPNNPLLLLNVLSPRERDRIKQLSTAPAFLQALDDLYHLTRNPNRIDRNGDNLPEQELLIGLTAPNLNTNLNLRTGPLQTEKLGDLPKALTAGPGTGTGFITVVENNDPSLSGLPVTLHVIQIADGPFRGDIKVLYPDNVFDEKLTLRHSADFAGEPQRFEFEWYYMPDDPALDHTILPTVDGAGDLASLNNWTRYPGIPPGTNNGFNDITIGDGAVGGLLTLADNWFLCRYRGYSINGATNWTDWVGVIGGGGPQLAEGWVKRVVFGLNPFEARTDEFHENETVTFASMLQQAGARYEGDIAFNPSGGNINSVGLISAYQTVLNRAKNLSINATPGINYPPANNALLLAASRLSDFYMLLGNEAYADAADPTIGFRTDNAGYGTLAPSIFTFQNQLDSLLEEELVLLRGRDDRSATVRSAPVYNRLFWNFTHDEGEVAYAQAYNITDQNSDGFITADDGRILYPQGHGDAWGHYLTATKSYYTLLQNTNFDWIPRSESILLAGVPVEVDYLDERKFARAAAAKAKTGAELVGLTYRINYVDDPTGQYQGYKDTDASRAWGLSEWAHRTGSGAFFDWVVANTILPATDPNTNHVGIEKIDRTSVTELDEIVAGFENVQNQMDKADSGLNPLGLAKNVVPFDIDPALISAGKTHFEQIYDRAIEAVKNTVTVFNHANQLSQALRSLQDSVNDFSQNADQQERDYKNRMIELFGYPYAGDIGPGRTYPSGYDGPDLYHYMYVGTLELNGNTAPPSQTFTGFFTPKLGLNTVRPQGLVPEVEVDFHGIKASFGEPDFFFPADAPGNPGDRLTNQVLAVNFPYSASDYGFTAPASWGSRRAPGEIQIALSEFVQNQARFKQAQLNYDNLIQQLDDQIELLQVRYDVEAERVEIQNHEFVTKLNLKAKAAAAKKIAEGLKWASTKLNQSTDVAVEALPKSVGLATDATSGLRSVLKALKYVATSVLDLGARGAELAEHSFSEAKKELPFETALEVQFAGFPYEVQQQFNVLEEIIRQEVVLRVEAFAQREVLTQSLGRYEAAVARGLRLLEERTAFRKNAAADTQASRYQDMTFRIFRNDAIQKYRAQYDLAAQYVFLAAVAYDFETQLLGNRPGAGRAFLTDIVRQRALGELVNGVPIAGRHGLADPLARLNQNFGVLKGQLGFNNPQTETGRFSLRNELFRQRDTSDEQWRAELKKSVVPDLWQIPEFRRYCRPFAPESAGPQPGIVIRFPTTVTFGLNYFGWPLGGGDSAYDSTLFATKVRSAGVWFENYLGSGLSQTPRVYLVPVGADVMRSPSGNDLATREWRVVDQKIPVPFPIGFSSLNSSTWIPMNDSLSDTFADIRRFSSFRAYHDSGVFNPAETITDSRLIGRSVWNTDWMLIIPGGTFLFDPDQGLDTFINTVGDIKIFYQTYSYSGN